MFPWNETYVQLVSKPDAAWLSGIMFEKMLISNATKQAMQNVASCYNVSINCFCATNASLSPSHCTTIFDFHLMVLLSAS